MFEDICYTKRQTCVTGQNAELMRQDGLGVKEQTIEYSFYVIGQAWAHCVKSLDFSPWK